MKMRKFGAVCTALLLALLLALPGYASGGAAEEAPLPEASLPEELPPAAADLPLEEDPPLAELPPVEEETPSAGEETPPTEGETPPAGEETPPIEEETPPAGEETPPAEGETPPAEEETPPTEEETPPTEEETPPAEEEVPPEEVETPPAEVETPPAAPETSSMEVNAPVLAPETVPEVYAEPVISVEAPTSASVMINPYRMKVSLDGTESTDAVIGRNEIIRNYSTVPVRVEVSASGAASQGSGAVLVTEPPTPETEEKAVFMYLEFQPMANEYGVPTWSGAFQDEWNQVLVNGPEKGDVLILPASGPDGAPGCGALRLFGETAPSPAQMWTAADVVEVTVSFTFTAEETAPVSWLEPVADAPVADSGAIADGEPAVDSEAPVEGEPVVDGEAPVDGEPIVDGEAPVDDGAPADSGSPVDSGSPADSEVIAGVEPSETVDAPTDAAEPAEPVS